MIVTRKRLILAFLTMCCVFGGVIWYFPNPQILIVMRAFQLSFSLTVVRRYAPSVIKAFNDEYVTERTMIAFGFCAFASVIAANAAWLLLWRSADEPRWMVDASINGFMVLFSIYTAGIEIGAPNTNRGQIDPVFWRYIGVAVVSSVVLSVVALTFGDQARAITDWLAPFLAEDWTDHGSCR